MGHAGRLVQLEHSKVLISLLQGSLKALVNSNLLIVTMRFDSIITLSLYVNFCYCID